MYDPPPWARIDRHRILRYLRWPAGLIPGTVLIGTVPAASRGAKENGGRTVGCNIKLPREQHANAYLDKWVIIEYFFVDVSLFKKFDFNLKNNLNGNTLIHSFLEEINGFSHKQEDVIKIITLFYEKFRFSFNLKNNLGKTKN